MPPRLSWSKLLPGLVALTVIALITAGVLLFGGIGVIRGDTVRLYVLTEQSRGVMKGTEVWLLGQKVGVVGDITFRPASADTMGRVVIAIDVRAADAKSIRRDSPAAVRSGANLIGPVVVYIDAGDPGSAVVRPGDTLRARPPTDFQVATAKLSAATAELPGLMTDARSVIASIHDRRGTLGAALAGGAGGEVAGLRASVSRARSQFTNARFGVPVREARAALARVDSIRTLLRSDRSSLGRYRRDSTLAGEVASLRDELAGLRALLERPDGTLQRWNTDSALTRSIADAQREMTNLFADMRHRPMRYFPF